MLSSIVILSTLAASALGSNSTSYSYQLPAGFNIGLVKPDELNSWCQGQRNICPELCKSGTKVNYCDPTTLNFECTCADGTTPDVSQYQQSVPFYVCQANYGQCIDAHPNDANGQRACKQAAQCGTKNASAADATSSSAAPSSTIAMATSSESSASSTSSAAAQSTTNAAIALGQEYSTGLMATILFVAARMFL